MAHADSAMIRWLLYDSNIRRAAISRETGISQATLGRLYKGEATIELIQFGTAQALTAYAERVRKERELDDEENKKDNQT